MHVALSVHEHKIDNGSTNYNEIVRGNYQSNHKATSDESELNDNECYTKNLEMECSSDTENIEKSKTNALILIL